MTIKQNWFKYTIYIWISLVLIIAILSPNKVGMLKETTKNMYFHVPMSITATIAFFSALWHSIVYLKTKNELEDLKAQSSAELGFMFNILAMVTGAFWAKFMWGEYWHWDPRQTTIFLLFLIYAAYFALRSAIDSPEKRGNLSAVYNIFAFPSVIFLYFVLPRLVPGLHPGAPEKGTTDVNPSVSSSTDPEIRIILYLSMIGFIALFFWLKKLRYRIEVLDHQLSTSH